MSLHVVHPSLAPLHLPAAVLKAGSFARVWALVVLEALAVGLLVVLGVVIDG